MILDLIYGFGLIAFGFIMGAAYALTTKEQDD
jgi:hypothetical protein